MEAVGLQETGRAGTWWPLTEKRVLSTAQDAAATNGDSLAHPVPRAAAKRVLSQRNQHGSFGIPARATLPQCRERPSSWPGRLPLGAKLAGFPLRYSLLVSAGRGAWQGAWTWHDVT